MTPERWRKINELFEAAIALPALEREDFIANSCGSDMALRDEVVAMLASDRRRTDFLARPPVEGLARRAAERVSLSASVEAGQRVGAYQLIEQIATGGMGAVWLADRADDQFHKKVAIKLIKRGMDTDVVVRRFRAERQVLARLEHPNIGRLYDGGATEGGQPYLVMEHIQGTPIDRYCDEGRLSIRQRLELVRKVCEAVQYAHQNLVVHRDLKPSNILVTPDGVVKLLDFGIAKVLGGEEAEGAGGATIAGQRMMTPEYASPEQVRGEPITTASDVYSLGVVLYELLCGERPYQPANESLREYERVICEEEPLPASGRVRDDDQGEIAARRGTDQRALRRQLRGDLDMIVLKALRKEPQRRYASAERFSNDIQQQLESRPVQARPDSLYYRTTKFVRRNKALFVASAGLLIVLAGGLIGTTYGLVQARKQRSEAQARQQEAEKIAVFMQRTLSGVGPSIARGRDTTILKEMMDTSAKRIEEGELKDSGKAELRLRASIGDAYRELGEYAAAHRMIDPMVELGYKVFGKDDDANNADVLAYRERLFYDDGKLEEALEAGTKVLEMTRRSTKGDDPYIASSLNNLGAYLMALGRANEALPKCEEALAMSQRLHKGDDEDVARCLVTLGNCLDRVGRVNEAVARHKAALEMQKRLFKGDDPEVATSLGNVASDLVSTGDLSEAIAPMEESLAMRQRLFKGDHPSVAFGLCDLATILGRLGRPSEALAKSEAGLAMYQRLYNGDHHSIADALQGTAVALASLNRGAEALSRSEQALAMNERLFKGDHPDVGLGLFNVAMNLKNMTRPAEALPKFEAALAMFERILPPGHFHILVSKACLGTCLVDLNRYDEAEAMLLAALPELERSTKASDRHKSRAFEAIVRLYDATNQPDKAARWRKEFHSWQAATQPAVSLKSLRTATTMPVIPTTGPSGGR